MSCRWNPHRRARSIPVAATTTRTVRITTACLGTCWTPHKIRATAARRLLTGAGACGVDLVYPDCPFCREREKGSHDPSDGGAGGTRPDRRPGPRVRSRTAPQLRPVARPRVEPG